MPAPPPGPPVASITPPVMTMDPMGLPLPPPMPAPPPVPRAVMTPPRMWIRAVRSRPAPLSLPMPAPPGPPAAVREPSAGPRPPGEPSRSMRRQAPSPRDTPAHPAPLSKRLLDPLWSSRVTLFSRPRLKALPEEVRHTTPPRVSSMEPMLSARAILPLKGVWLASVPDPPDTAVTRLDRMRRVWVSSSYTQSRSASPPVTVKGFGYILISWKDPVCWFQRR